MLDTSPMAKVKVQDVPMPRRPPGYYEEVILKKYWRNCKVVDGKEICGEEVDCSNAIKVLLDINPHELKRVDDNSERFELVFIMKMYWLDPLLHSFPTKLIRRRPEPQLKPFEPPLQEVEGIVRRKYKNGDLLFVEKEGDARYKKAVLIKKDDYVKMEEPAWDHYFFPNYTFLNLVSTDGDAGCAKLQWCGEEGGFVEYARRYDAVFQETLELRRFPMDRQLCRIKLTAEADIQTFQFVVLEGEKQISQVSHDEWRVENHMQKKCTTYIRYADEKFPYPVQRSSVKTVLHLQRKGDYYFHNVLINIFLVNVIALFSFAVPVSDTGDRLSLLSTTLVAVTAYQTVINQSIPRKAYLTACDKYVIFAVIFQVLIGIETTIVAFIFQYHDWDEEMPARIRLIDSIVGMALGTLWIVSNGAILLFFHTLRDSWKAVYEMNEEPFAPMLKCLKCREKWHCKQATHSEEPQRQVCPFCGEQSAQLRKHYYTPSSKGFDMEPLVKRGSRHEWPMKAPAQMMQGDEAHVAEFNAKFLWPWPVEEKSGDEKLFLE